MKFTDFFQYRGGYNKHKEGVYIGRIFLEQKMISFSDKDFGSLSGLETHIVSEKKHNTEINTKQKEQIEATVFKIDEKVLQKAIEDLFDEGNPVVRKKIQRTITRIIKRLEENNVLEQVSQNIRESLAKSGGEKRKKGKEKERLLISAENILEDAHMKYVEIHKKKVASLVPVLHSKNVLSDEEIDIIADVGIESIVLYLDESVDLPLFFQKFEKIQYSEDLYETLDIDLVSLITNDDISFAYKDTIFNTFIRLYRIEKNEKKTKKEDIIQRIIQEKEMEMCDYVKQINAQRKERKRDIESLVQSRKEHQEENERFSIERNVLQREREMLRNVKHLLGENVAKKAEERMNQYEKADAEKRYSAYFDYINKEIKPSLEILDKQEISFIRQYAIKQEKVLHFAIDLMEGYSKAVRKEKQKRLSEEFGIFHEYLDVLLLSIEQDSYLPIAVFLKEGGKTKAQKDGIKNLRIFSDSDIALIRAIESQKHVFESEVEEQRRLYREECLQLNILEETTEFKQLKNADPQCKKRGKGSLFEYIKQKNILTEEGIIALYGKNSIEYRPKYFVHANTFCTKYIDDRTFNKAGYLELEHLLLSNGKIVLPKSVVLHFGKKVSSRESVSPNVLTLFTKDRIVQAGEDIVRRIHFVAQEVIDYANDTGSFDKDGIVGKIKETYTFFENTKSLVELKLKAIQHVGIRLHTIFEKNNENTNGIYRREIEKILRQLEKNYTSLRDTLTTYTVSYKDEKTGKFVSHHLKTFIDEAKTSEEKYERLVFVNAEIQKIATQYSKENLQNFLDDIDTAFQKDSEQNTGGKNVYIVLSGVNPDVFKAPNISLQEKIVFQLLSEKKGVTTESIEMLQALMQEKNTFGEYYIIAGENNTYNPNKNQIVLEKSVFEAIKSFDKHSEDIQKLSFSPENIIFHEQLSFVFHELGHSMVEKNRVMLLRFKMSIKDAFADEYSDFVSRMKTIYTGKSEEEAFEELFVEVGSLLQFTGESRDALISENSLLASLFQKVSEKQLQDIFTLELYEDIASGKKAVKGFDNAGRENERTESSEYDPESYYDREEQKIKEQEKLEMEHKDNPEFYSDTIRMEKRKAFNSIVYGNEEGKYQKMNKSMIGYIDQLQDAQSYITGPAESSLKDVVQTLKRYKNTVIDYFNDGEKNNTENKADILLQFAQEVRDIAQQYTNELSRFHSEPGNIFSRAWKNTRFLSADNVLDIAQQWWNYFVRRFKRRSKERVGAVGNAMATGIAPGLATDFAKQQDDANNADVEEFQGSYKTLDDGALMDEIDNVGPEDAFKAYMLEMAERGFIDWGRQDSDGKRVYAQKLNSYGSNIRFYENDFLYDYGEETALNNKFQKAFLDVYGEDDLFYSLYSTNKNAINSKTDDAVSVAAVRGGQPQQMLEWLYKHEHGEFVNPNVYEGFIKLMIDDGTTDPENYIYYLMAGVATGLLHRDAFSRFYGYAGNTFPPFNGMSGFTKADAQRGIKEVLLKEGAPKGSTNPDDYYNIWDGPPKYFGAWVHSNIMTIPSTLERTIINLGQKAAGKFDHDNAGLLASIGDADTAGKMLAQGSTGSLETKNTVYSQSIYGQVQHILGMANQNYTDEDMFQKLQKSVARQAGFFSATDALINSRLESSKSKFKVTEDFLRRSPRSDGHGYTTRDYLQMGREIYSHVYTPEFKVLAEEFLFADQYNNDPDGLQKKWKELLERYPYIKSHIFKGEAIPKMNNKGNIDQDYSVIVTKIFNHYFIDHPDARKNVEAVAHAAQDIYFGKEGHWGETDTGNIPYQFVESYKKTRGMNPLS